LGQDHLYLMNPYDQHGIFSTISAITTCYIGLFISQIMNTQNYNSWKKLGLCMSTGSWLIGISLLMDASGMRINRSLWSTSFALLSASIGTVIFANITMIVDIWGYITVFQPQIWLGSNWLLVYIIWKLWFAISAIWIHVHGLPLRTWLLGMFSEQILSGIPMDIESVIFLFGIVELTFWSLFASILYKRRIFPRLL
jgi:predicted acyltransferase